MADRHPNSQTVGIRLSQGRLAATGDGTNGRLVHSAYKPGAGGANLPTTEGAAEWGAPFPVEGVDIITALIDLVWASATTLEVAAQVAPKETGENWYDVYIPDAAGSVQRFQPGVPTTANVKVALPVPVSGRWMRLKIWAPAATSDRATIRVIRDQAGAAN